MSDMNNYLANQLIQGIFRAGGGYAPSHLWIALLTTAATKADTGTTIEPGGGGTGVEVTGTGYARVQLDPSTGNWANYVTGTQQTSNTPIITFPTPGGSWGTVVAMAIIDASAHGNILYQATLQNPVAIGVGVVASFASGALIVEVDN